MGGAIHAGKPAILKGFSMQLSITIDLDGDAFTPNGYITEVERLLASVAERLPSGLSETQGGYQLHDENGNWCGEFRIDEKPERDALVALLREAIPYIEETEQFHKPTCRTLSKRAKIAVQRAL